VSYHVWYLYKNIISEGINRPVKKRKTKLLGANKHPCVELLFIYLLLSRPLKMGAQKKYFSISKNEKYDTQQHDKLILIDYTFNNKYRYNEIGDFSLVMLSWQKYKLFIELPTCH